MCYYLHFTHKETPGEIMKLLTSTHTHKSKQVVTVSSTNAHMHIVVYIRFSVH